MRKLPRLAVLLAAVTFACTMLAYGQDDAPPSLGDVARQARQQKQQKDAQADKAAPSKDAPNKDVPNKDVQNKDVQGGKDVTAKDTPAPKAPHVVTNDEIPSHIGPTVTQAGTAPAQYANNSQPSYGKAPAETWKNQIQQMKSAIASLESQIASLNESIHYAGGNCVSGCVQWNERQKQKQDQVEAMKTQQADMQKRLEDMQEAARQQGYGSSVYDP